MAISTTFIPPSSIIKNILFVSLVLLTLANCAGLDSKNMVAQVDETAAPFTTGQSIAKIEIRGEKEEVFGGPAFAQKDQIIDAARATLRNSGLFTSVDEGQGELRLEIIVRSQNQLDSMMLEYTAVTTITYRFTDPSGKIVWFKTYETEFSSHAFSGATRTVEAREGSVRENLASLVEGISTSWKN
ncbi:MAG: hypothetical protein V7752_12315 [Halopseudomonas sp.]